MKVMILVSDYSKNGYTKTSEQKKKEADLIVNMFKEHDKLYPEMNNEYIYYTNDGIPDGVKYQDLYVCSEIIKQLATGDIDLVFMSDGWGLSHDLPIINEICNRHNISVAGWANIGPLSGYIVPNLDSIFNEEVTSDVSTEESVNE